MSGAGLAAGILCANKGYAGEPAVSEALVDMDPVKYDVIVCGAGSAGYSAAIAAARAGAKTLLIEEDSVPGGAAVDMCVCSFSQGPVIEGLHGEVCDRLAAIDPYYKKEKPDAVFMPFSLVSVLFQMFQESGVNYLGNAKIVNVSKKAGAVRSVMVYSPAAGRNGYKEYCGKVFIDATGNADIAFAAGAPYRFGREAASEFGEKFAPANADKVIQKVTWMFIVDAFRTPDKPAAWCEIGDNKYLIWGSSERCADPLDPAHLAKANQASWQEMRRKFDEFENIGYRPIYIPPKVGVRETRRIDGEYMLNYNDLINGRVFDDAICRAKRIIDSWEPEGNPMHRDPDACRVPMYTIPYRSLLPKNVEDLLVAGRCISATHVANSSARIQPICSMIGQAAGTAAALAVEKQISPRRVSIQELQKRLRSGGLGI
jgi:hypothetical protein